MHILGLWAEVKILQIGSNGGGGNYLEGDRQS